MASDFTVLNYDRRGRGDSGNALPYAVEREIEDLGAVIAAAGGSAAVFGNSSGAVLALRAAAAGLPIISLALWEPPFQVDPDGRRRARKYADQLAGLLAAGRRGDAITLFLSTVGLPEQATAGIRHSPSWPGMEAVAPTLAYDAAVMGDGTVPTALISSLKVPTLILSGGNTGAWAESAARALMATLPAAEQRVLEQQTHAVAWDVLATELRQYFARAKSNR